MGRFRGALHRYPKTVQDKGLIGVPGAKAKDKLMDMDVVYMVLINGSMKVLMPSSKIVVDIIGIGESMKCSELG